jgi:putative (di)nucleoside polyphosphate hydrolase
MLANAATAASSSANASTLPGAWQMPQGGIDKGETPRDAGLRELHEETGVAPPLVTVEAETKGWVRYDLPADLLGKVWKGRFRGQEQKWLLLRFHGTDADIDIATRHPEFSRWRWLAPDDLLAQITPSSARLRQVLAEFAPPPRVTRPDCQPRLPRVNPPA